MNPGNLRETAQLYKDYVFHIHPGGLYQTVKSHTSYHPSDETVRVNEGTAVRLITIRPPKGLGMMRAVMQSVDENVHTEPRAAPL